MLRKRPSPVFSTNRGEVGVNASIAAPARLVRRSYIDYLGVDARRCEGRSGAGRRIFWKKNIYDKKGTTYLCNLTTLPVQCEREDIGTGTSCLADEIADVSG